MIDESDVYTGDLVLVLDDTDDLSVVMGMVVVRDDNSKDVGLLVAVLLGLDGINQLFQLIVNILRY